jgi:hypothetical protein
MIESNFHLHEKNKLKNPSESYEISRDDFRNLSLRKASSEKDLLFKKLLKLLTLHSEIDLFSALLAEKPSPTPL